MIKKLFFFIMCLPIFTMCTHYRDITYLRNLKPSAGDSLYKCTFTNYQIQPADILYIEVNSLDQNINSVFNQTSQNSNATISSEGGYYIYGYSVDSDGAVNLPVFGKIKVSGLTITGAQDAILKQAEKYITNVRVEVKLMSFKISVIGEVKRPGQYSIFNDKANIFEAIAIAGDVSYYGNRKNILLLRNKPEGTNTYRIDLTDKNFLSSHLYYLQPNDIIYVEPLKSTGLKLSASDYSVLISTLSVTLTTIVLIFNLLK